MRHPAVSEAAVYAVPDESSGDQLVAALVLAGDLDPVAWEAFLGVSPEPRPKQWPRYVRILDALPGTGDQQGAQRELRTMPLDGGGTLDPAMNAGQHTVNSLFDDLA